MQIIIWVVIILFILFVVWLLKRWIKRIIFIIILLCLAFFIYGIFSPSGAFRLRYNVRTFPQRIISRTSNQSFLDYDKYKSNITTIGDNITIDADFNKEIENVDGTTEQLFDTNETTKDIHDESANTITNEELNNEGRKIRSFDQISFPKLEVNSPAIKEDDKNKDSYNITKGSKSDLLKIINSYIEKQLNDNTDILVTIEYEEDSEELQKIILQPQTKTEKSESHSSGNTKSINIENEKINQSTVSSKSSNTLSQKELKEAEEIYQMIF